jgi:hypothetical protein
MKTIADDKSRVKCFLHLEPNTSLFDPKGKENWEARRRNASLALTSPRNSSPSANNSDMSLMLNKHTKHFCSIITFPNQQQPEPESLESLHLELSFLPSRVVEKDFVPEKKAREKEIIIKRQAMANSNA